MRTQTTMRFQQVSPRPVFQLAGLEYYVGGGGGLGTSFVGPARLVHASAGHNSCDLTDTPPMSLANQRRTLGMEVIGP